MIKGRRTAFADFSGIGLSKFQHPQSNRLVANVDPSLRENILNVPLAHRKTKMEPNGSFDNIRVETVAPIRDFLHRGTYHPIIHAHS